MFHLFIRSSLQTLATTDHFTVSVVLPILESHILEIIQFSCSAMSNSLQPHGLQHCRISWPSPSPGAQTHVFSVGDTIQPSCPLSYPLLTPLIFPSIKVFSNELALCIQRPKYWSFSFSFSPSNEWCLAFFMVQLSHPYMATGKTIALTRRLFVGKVISLFF